jgi:hypothetical protein
VGQNCKSWVPGSPEQAWEVTKWFFYFLFLSHHLNPVSDYMWEVVDWCDYKEGLSLLSTETIPRPEIHPG